MPRWAMNKLQCLICLRDSADLWAADSISRNHVQKYLRPLLIQFETVPGRVKTEIRMKLVLPVRDYQIIWWSTIYLRISNSQTQIAWVFYFISFFFFSYFIIIIIIIFALFASSVSNPMVQICNLIATIVPFRWNELGRGSVCHLHLLLLRSAPLKSSCDRIFSF